MRQREDLSEAIKGTEVVWEGKTLGLKITDEVRERLDAQSEAWGLESNKRTILTAMLMGLKQMEFLDKLRKVPGVKRPKRFAPGHSNGHRLPALVENFDDQDSLPEVSKLFGSNDQGGDPLGPPVLDELDLSRP